MTTEPFGNSSPSRDEHDALDTTMELLSGMPGHPGAQTAPAAPLWLGATLADERLAIPLADIICVFKSSSTSASQAALAPLEVEIHSGSPVFITSLFHLFEPAHGMAVSPQGQRSDDWVIARQHPLGSLLGCRVHTVHGPFYAFAQADGHVLFEGKGWRLYSPKGLSHA